MTTIHSSGQISWADMKNVARSRSFEQPTSLGCGMFVRMSGTLYYEFVKFSVASLDKRASLTYATNTAKI